tara:strand:- start:41 stop:1240 length:1200 start_codon:yes stop_codon:yes gene_type:complete
MAIDWAKVRSAMTDTPDYNPGAWGGAGQHYGNVPGYKGSGYGQNQRNEWMRNFGSRPNAGGGADYMSTIGTPSKAKAAATVNPNAWSQARYEMTRDNAYGMDEEELAQKGGVWDAARAAGSKFTTPLFELGRQVLGGVGDMAEGISRGTRLHKAFKDKYGGSGEWKAAKAAMMTPKDQAFYDKYMRLADMAQDNQKAQEYRDIAETAWRNQQTTDRLAQTMGFEGYDDPKYSTPGMPGYERMKNNPYIQSLMAAGTERPVGLQYDDPDMLNEILPGEPGVDLRPYAGMESGIDYEAMGLAPDPENDLLYGEPGYGGITPIRKDKPSPDDFYDYPDEKYLPAPWSPYNTYRDEDYGAPIQPSWWDRFKKAPFENLPFYSGLFDWNLSPEYPEIDITEDIR